jgi:hypothetical protein
MSKILRIDLQSYSEAIFEDKEDLRTSLVDMHEIDMDTEEDKKTLKIMPLDGLCGMFDWEYKTITDKQAKEYEGS